MGEFYRLIVREQVLKLHRSPTARQSRALLIRCEIFNLFRAKILAFSTHIIAHDTITELCDENNAYGI